MVRLISFLALAALLAAGCDPPQDGAAKPDPLLGKWVMLADNVSAEPDATIEFKADGTAVIKAGKEAPLTLWYRRESGRAWLSRRVSDPKELEAPAYADWTRPGVEMILFATSKDGEFADTGGMVLTLDPERKVLYNFLTQLWCRPGDEARVRKLWGMDARAEEQKARAARLEAWRPEKDLSANWRVAWSLDFAEGGTTVGDLNGDGEPEIVASAPTGFAVVDARGQVLRGVKMSGELGDSIVLGRRDGKGLVLRFDTWGNTVRAYDPEGPERWMFSTSAGIDWVAPVELDARNTGFVIGYNGGGGIDFLEPGGKKAWHADVNANVWSVAGARLQAGLPGAALCVASDGALAFDAKGKQIHSYGPEDAGAVGAADLDGDGVDEVLTLGTTQVSGGRVTVFGADGQRRWSKKASGVDVMHLDGRPFVCGKFGGERLLGVGTGLAIRFFDRDGAEVGDLVVRDGIVGIAALPRQGKPDALLVRTRKALRCYEWRD